MVSEISARRLLLEPSFRYLSSGREGERCRALDHMKEIPFFHSARLKVSRILIYTQQCSSNFPHMVRSSVSSYFIYLTVAHALLQKEAVQGHSHYLCLVLFHTVRAGEYWHKTNGISACAFAKQKILRIIPCRPVEFFLSLLFLLCLFQK